VINNQSQYCLTKDNAALFKAALDEIKIAQCPSNVDPLMFKAQRDGMESQLATLLEEILRYESI
jgi:hypothetical protein